MLLRWIAMFQQVDYPLDKQLHGSTIKIIPILMPSDSIDELYERISQVGEGTYGKVYKARCRTTGELVALKKIRMETEKEGFPVTAAREIKLLKSMSHPNIVSLQKISASSSESVYLVFEYLEFDLAGLLPTGLRTSQTKCIMRGILMALDYLHRHFIVHRDLKGSNVLVSRAGEVKLADFGLAKCFRHPDKPTTEEKCNRMMTNRVVTLWYRPPEVLLGCTWYGPEVDIWSAGCILLELLNGKAVFTGQDELTQLQAICQRLGRPVDWENSSLPWLRIMQDDLGEVSRSLEEEFGEKLGKEGLDLVLRMLEMNPERRLSANEALNHPWFRVDPLPCDPIELTKGIEGDWHEYECKQRRKTKTSSIRSG